MKNFLLLLVAALMLSGCGTPPPVPEPANAGRLKNACMPEAAEMTQGLLKADIKARVLVINTTTYSHAVCAYMWPTGANQIWVWDSEWKSVQLHGVYWDEADGIAIAWLAKCNAGSWGTFVSAQFL